MKKSKFGDQQIAFGLQQAETGTAVGDVCRKLGISEGTFYRWKERYGGLMSSEVRKLPQSYGAEGKITFSPGNSVWKFSAAARYGRSHGTKCGHQEKDAVPSDFPSSIIPRPTYIVNFSDTRTETSEAHTIVDFQVGRDVGLGFFSDRADSEINFGVRFAQFNYESTNELYARPDFTLESKYFPTFQRSIPVHHTYHLYHANSHSTRSFQGIGPSLS